MRFRHILPLAGLVLAAAGPNPALAQGYTGQEITVNPVTPGSNVLLYPGGQYMRVVRPLLQPGESRKDTGAIQLHLPSKARSHTATIAEAPPRRRRSAKVAEAAPPTPPPAPAPPADASSEFSPFRPPPAGVTSAPAAPPPPRPQIAAAPAPKPAPPRTPAPARQVARAEPPPARITAPPAAAEPVLSGLTKRSMILFAPESPDPAKSALGQIKFLAGELTAAMTGASSRIQLQANGGEPGDKSSDARRLSLKRALAIRQVLIDDGVPADRIDVHAEGGVDDSGPADRVDVYIKA